VKHSRIGRSTSTSNLPVPGEVRLHSREGPDRRTPVDNHYSRDYDGLAR
jgi:hypothetical protein